MPHMIKDPFSDAEYEACSYAVAAKAKAKPSGMSEADWEKSKLQGSWGVAKGKYESGELKDGVVFAIGEGYDGKMKYQFYKGKVQGIPKGGSPNWMSPEAFAAYEMPYSKVQFLQVGGKLPPTPAVNAAVKSVGKLTDEDMAAMFVKTKDDFAKAKGINIKGANPALDKEVYDSLAKFTGYTGADVAAKIERYKASGKKLSALKKQVASGKKVVPTPPVPGAAKEAFDDFAKVVKKPNVIDASAKPTVETVKKAVDDLVDKSLPALSDEEIVKAYIKAKDTVVALANEGSVSAFANKGWTLYTPVQGEFKEAILKQMGQFGAKLDTYVDVEKALAAFKASGKKLSTLKKQMIKDDELGPFKAPTGKTPVAPGTSKPKPSVAKDVDDKVKDGFTPPGSSPYSLTDADEEAVFANLKHSIYAGSPEGSLYAHFSKQALELEAKYGSKVSALDVMRAYDKKKAIQLGVDNIGFYEAKLAKWASTPQGEQVILQLKADHIASLAQAKKKAEAMAKFEELQKNIPDLPEDSIRFQHITTDHAKDLSDKMTSGSAARWTHEQHSALKTYTGGSYQNMNNALRDGKSSPHVKSLIKDAQDGMRPSPEDMLLERGTGYSQFGVETKEELFSLIGQEFEDAGFMSTSVGGNAAFGGAVKLTIEAPTGTAMAYLQPFSNFPSEREMLLAAGTRFKILRVELDNYGQALVRVRAIPGSHKIPSYYEK